MGFFVCFQSDLLALGDYIIEHRLRDLFFIVAMNNKITKKTFKHIKKIVSIHSSIFNHVWRQRSYSPVRLLKSLIRNNFTIILKQISIWIVLSYSFGNLICIYHVDYVQSKISLQPYYILIRTMKYFNNHWVSKDTQKLVHFFSQSNCINNVIHFESWYLHQTNKTLITSYWMVF